MRWDNAPKQAGGAWELCKAQHGVVARRQLLRLGLSERTIERRLASRRLHPVLLGGRQLRGVYAVGRPDVTQRGRWMAAVLACGEQAALSHASAAALMGILGRERGCIEVSVPRGHSARSRGIRVHRPTCLPSEDLGTFDGIPVTSPIKTLIDLATFLSVPKLEAAVNAADKHDLVDPEQLRVALEARPGLRGVRALRDLLDRHTFRLTRSKLERYFLPIVRRAGLPTPETRVWLNGYEVDFFWPEPRPRGRDGRAALPPHGDLADARPRARPGSCPRGPHPAEVLALSGSLRARARGVDARPGCAPAGGEPGTRSGQAVEADRAQSDAPSKAPCGTARPAVRSDGEHRG